jgi:hypothetical protein
MYVVPYTSQWSLLICKHHMMMSPEIRPDVHAKGTFKPNTRQQASLHVPLQKFAVEITSDGVVDEPFRSLGLSTCLVLEYHIIIPPANTCRARLGSPEATL